MKKFYEVLRESFSVETLKNYRKVKTFDKLVDALIYARRYSRDCGGKRQFLQMLVFEIQPDDGDYAPLAAEFLTHADEAKLIYKAESDGVLRACNTEAEQTGESNKSEEADTTSASSTLYKGSDGKMYSVQEASYMAEGRRSWFACRCYHDTIYNESWCKLHLVPFYNYSSALDYLKKYALRNKIQLTEHTDFACKKGVSDMKKPIYYMMESSNENSFRKAEPLKAESLIAAKREASRKAAFYDSVLTIGTEIDEDGFLVPSGNVAIKSIGIWNNL